MQVKLLRLLQEREFRPVGSLVTKKVQIRVMAATHRDLAREVENKNFRLDLFYRLNVVCLRLPPRRDRFPCRLSRCFRIDRPATRRGGTGSSLDSASGIGIRY